MCLQINIFIYASLYYIYTAYYIPRRTHQMMPYHCFGNGIQKPKNIIYIHPKTTVPLHTHKKWTSVHVAIFGWCLFYFFPFLYSLALFYFSLFILFVSVLLSGKFCGCRSFDKLLNAFAMLLLLSDSAIKCKCVGNVFFSFRLIFGYLQKKP